MGIGPVVRRMFGQHEHRIAELYRSIYVDLDSYVDQIAAWFPRPRRILEVGCGEGATTERLAARYSDADILAIDITPRAGRLFRGSSGRVTFMETTVQEVAQRCPQTFDLAVVSDVIHHVPAPMRIPLLQATRQAMAPDGLVIFKDWERTFSPIHWLCYASDRCITGDRIRYLRKCEANDMVTEVFGVQSIIAEARVRPWRNNFMMMVEVA